MLIKQIPLEKTHYFYLSLTNFLECSLCASLITFSKPFPHLYSIIYARIHEKRAIEHLIEMIEDNDMCQ